MRKTIKVGNKDVELLSTALTSMAYKKIFNDDILQAIGTIRDGTSDGHIAADTIEDISKLAYVMNLQATTSTVRELFEKDEMAYFEWLNQFERLDFYKGTVIGEIITVWSGNLETSIDSKNAEGAQQDP